MKVQSLVPCQAGTVGSCPMMIPSHPGLMSNQDRETSFHEDLVSFHPGSMSSQNFGISLHKDVISSQFHSGLEPGWDGTGSEILVSHYQFLLLFLNKQLSFHLISSWPHVKLVLFYLIP